jgi:hypothetical protein
MKHISLTVIGAGSNPGAEPTSVHLWRNGYLLRGWLTVRKVAEVKRRVLGTAKLSPRSVSMRLVPQRGSRGT